jgi:hypothetical protein
MSDPRDPGGSDHDDRRPFVEVRGRRLYGMELIELTQDVYLGEYVDAKRGDRFRICGVSMSANQICVLNPRRGVACLLSDQFEVVGDRPPPRNYNTPRPEGMGWGYPSTDPDMTGSGAAPSLRCCCECGDEVPAEFLSTGATRGSRFYCQKHAANLRFREQRETASIGQTF